MTHRESSAQLLNSSYLDCCRENKGCCLRVDPKINVYLEGEKWGERSRRAQSKPLSQRDIHSNNRTRESGERSGAVTVDLHHRSFTLNVLTTQSSLLDLAGSYTPRGPAASPGLPRPDPIPHAATSPCHPLGGGAESLIPESLYKPFLSFSPSPPACLSLTGGD
ncbi:hypothetical protein ElyMa_002097800 [Elysia marginata]|uniref:Uncharacterized protein n=1 Tax=Elysia marginata TaxID=1093978 RepID=A0AAV4FFB0_9GAST|nr:hypothetical protein ElyMa_002097800 [Elysia marginata]